MAASTKALLAAATAVLFCAGASTEGHGRRMEKMPFDECLALIDEVADELGTTALDVRRTRAVHSARIEAADGHVLLVCSRVDQTVTLTKRAS